MIRASEEYASEFNLGNINGSQTVQDWENDRPEVEEVPAYHKRRSAGVWTCLATLTVGFAVIVVYGHAVLEQQGIQSGQIPGVTKSLSAIGEHLASVERRLADARAEERNLASQVHSLDAGSKAALGETQEQTGKLVARVQQSLVKNLNQQTSAFQAQVSQLVSERNADHLRLAQVEEQLVQARDELESTRKEYALQVAALREQQGEEHRELAAISNSLPTHQVTFEIQRNQEAEITPGVSFRLTKIDVRRERFDGWIESAPGNQKVSVQNQAVRTPIVFFPSDSSEAYVIVMTSVNQKGVDGYLLIPAGRGAAGPTNLISATDNPLSPTSIPSGHESSVAER